MNIAGRIGGGSWQLGYVLGDPRVLDGIRQAFVPLSGYYSLPENEMPLTASQLVEILKSRGI